MCMKKIVSFFCLLIGLSAKGQDFAFSQFYEMPMLRNPALSGIFNGDLRVSAAHRSQWGSISVPFRTTALGIEYKLPVFRYNDYLTMGMQLSYDVAGDLALKRTQLLPVIAFHKSLSENNDNFLSFAFMAGRVQSQFDPSAARLDDQFVNGAYSPSNSTSQVFNSTGYSYFDLSPGITYSSVFGDDSHYYLGAALFHCNSPKVNFFSSGSNVTLPAKLVFNAGLSTPVNDRDQVIAYVDYYQQAGSKQLFGGFLYESQLRLYDDENDNIILSVGGFYRWNDALIPVVKLKVHDWMVGFSYDINVSKLKTASQLQGGLEITASFLGFLNTNNSSRNRVRCVSFGTSKKTGWFSSK